MRSRRLTILVAMAVMMAMMLANAGMASAEGCAQPGTPLQNGSYHAKPPQACEGIAIAAWNSMYKR